MIRTTDRFARAFAFQQLGTAMTARIDESSDPAVLAVHDDQRDADQRVGEVVSRIFDVIGAADQIPALHENAGNFALIKLR